MSERSIVHAQFSIERTYAAAPGAIYAAWSTPAAKARWFGGAEAPEPGRYELDFRVGGHELNRATAPDGDAYTYRADFRDIVPDRRIVFVYDMYRGDIRISSSLATVELNASGRGTRLVFTEMGAFLDGLDKPEYREAGTAALLDALGAVLAPAA